MAPKTINTEVNMHTGKSGTRFSVVAIFLLPALVLYVLFYVVPALLGVGLSLFDWNGLDPRPEFYGLNNFRLMFSDPLFWNSVVINLEAVVISLVTQLPLALFLAVLLVRPGRGMRFFRMVFFIPQMLSLVAVGMLWQMIYQPVNGLANTLLNTIGLAGINWLGRPHNALLSLMIATTWTYFGYHMILQMAGISAIPREIFEAARLETNNAIQVFFRVTLPLLRETLLISTVMIVTGSFAFLMGLFWIMTEGGPVHGTELLGIHMYVQAFKSFRIGYASAIAVVMLVFITGVVVALIRLSSRERIEF